MIFSGSRLSHKSAQIVIDIDTKIALFFIFSVVTEMRSDGRRSERKRGMAAPDKSDFGEVCSCSAEEFALQCERAVGCFHQDLKGFVQAVGFLSSAARYVERPEYCEPIRRFQVPELMVFVATQPTHGDDFIGMVSKGVDIKSESLRLLKHVTKWSVPMIIYMNDCKLPQKLLESAGSFTEQQLHHLIGIITKMVRVLKGEISADIAQIASFASHYSETDCAAIVLLSDIVQLLDEISDADKLSFLSVFWRVFSPEFSKSLWGPSLDGMRILANKDPRLVEVQPEQWIRCVFLPLRMPESASVRAALSLLPNLVVYMDEHGRKSIRENIDPVAFLALLRSEDTETQRAAVVFFQALFEHSPVDYIESMNQFNFFTDLLACAEEAPFSVKKQIVELFCDVALKSSAVLSEELVRHGVPAFLLEVLEQLSIETDPCALVLIDTLIFMARGLPLSTREVILSSPAFTRIMHTDCRSSAVAERLQVLQALESADNF